MTPANRMQFEQVIGQRDALYEALELLRQHCLGAWTQPTPEQQELLATTGDALTEIEVSA